MPEQPTLWGDGESAGEEPQADDASASGGWVPSAAEDPNAALMRTMLSVSVPLFIAEFRRLTPDQRQEIAHGAADVIASSADGVVVPQKKADVRPAVVFNEIARGIAALAYLPGGVTIFGDHWCADVIDVDPPVEDVPLPGDPEVA